jgi:hypothetical protein
MVHPYRWGSNREDPPLPFNLLERDTPGPGTMPTGRFPGFGGTKIGVPERPCAALPGTHRIDLAASCLRIEKYAVSASVFNETLPTTDLSHVLPHKLSAIHGEPVRELIYFFFAHPHKAGRSGAAVSTPGTRKRESFGIPRHLLLVAPRCEFDSAVMPSAFDSLPCRRAGEDRMSHLIHPPI